MENKLGLRYGNLLKNGLDLAGNSTFLLEKNRAEKLSDPLCHLKVSRGLFLLTQFQD